MADITIAIASINTRTPLQLCLKSLWEFTDRTQVNLVIGDCGSTDGTLPMLTKYLAAGKIDDLDVAARGRRHAGWIDHWIATCTTPYLILMDSDIELRRDWWLPRLRAGVDAPATVFAAASMQPANPRYHHPVTGEIRDMGERPSVYLMMLDVELARDLGASFEGSEEASPESLIGKRCYDVGGAFLHRLQEHDRPYCIMADDYYLAYRHWGGVSWRGSVRGLRLSNARNRAKIGVRLGAYAVPRPFNRRVLDVLSSRPTT